MSRPTEPAVQVSDDLPGRPGCDASGANAGSADPVASDPVGAAEREVGRYIYRRIEALMDAEPGTADGAELVYLARVAESVEEYGEDACAGHSLAGLGDTSKLADLRDRIANISASDNDLAYLAVNVLHCRGAMSREIRREAVVAIRTYRDILLAARETLSSEALGASPSNASASAQATDEPSTSNSEA